jgi:hypothetical protein
MRNQAAVEATVELVKVLDPKVARYAATVLEACAYCGSGDVLKVQQMLAACGEHPDPESEAFQAEGDAHQVGEGGNTHTPHTARRRDTWESEAFQVQGDAHQVGEGGNTHTPHTARRRDAWESEAFQALGDAHQVGEGGNTHTPHTARRGTHLGVFLRF